MTEFKPYPPFNALQPVGHLPSFVSILQDSGGSMVRLSNFMSEGMTVQQGFDAARAFAQLAIDAGLCDKAEISCEGMVLETASTITFGAAYINTRIRDIGLLRPTGNYGDWRVPATGTLTDPLDEEDRDFFDRYQTVDTEEKEWNLARPLIRVLTGTPDFSLEDCYFTGDSTERTKLSAGIRAYGNSARRWLRRGLIRGVESYGFFVGKDEADTGNFNIDGTVILANSNQDRLDRTAYCAVLSGNDMHWRNFIFAYGHAPLLVGQYGATTMITDGDLFNGGQLETEGYPHRLVEYWGNTITWTGGRSGNGYWLMHTTDLAIFGTKFGVTPGAGDDPVPAAFVFVAHEANMNLSNFILEIGETPIALVSDINWFKFEVGDEPGASWGINTFALERIKGYVKMNSKAKVTYAQGANTPKVFTLTSGSEEGCSIMFEDPNTTSDCGIQIIGDTLNFVTNDVISWTVASNGVLRPVGGIKQFGSNADRVAEAYIDLFSGNNIFTMPTTMPALDVNGQLSWRRVGDTAIEFALRGSDGVTRRAQITGFAP